MKKALTLTVAFLAFGAFFISTPRAYASDYAFTTDDTNGSLDSVIGGETANFAFGDNSVYDEQIFYYKPGASHNLCTISVLMRADGSPTDSVAMDIRHATTTQGDTRSLGSIGALVQRADTEFQVRSGDFTRYDYTFTPCAVVVGANEYMFHIFRTGTYNSTNKYELMTGINHGGSSVTETGTATKNQVWGHIHNAYNAQIGESFSGTVYYSHPIFVLNGTENFSAVTPNDNTQTNCTPPSNILDVGGGISYSFCYLFLPSQAVITQFSGLQSTVAQKAPFSYISEFYNAYQGLTVATGTMPAVEINLQGSGYGSTSLMGNILPDIVFNKDSVTHYISNDVYNIFMALQALAFYLSAGFYIYRKVVAFKL